MDDILHVFSSLNELGEANVTVKCGVSSLCFSGQRTLCFFISERANKIELRIKCNVWYKVYYLVQ